MRTRLFAALTVLACAVATPAVAEVKKGDRAPELDGAKDSAGKAFSLKATQGKFVVMTFGGSWCKPCKKELPAWDKLAAKWKDKVTFVAVNLDNDSAKGKKFFDGLKIKNMIRVYAPEEKAAAADIYSPPTQPTTYVLSPKGIVLEMHEAYSNGDDAKMDKLLAKLVK